MDTGPHQSHQQNEYGNGQWGDMGCNSMGGPQLMYKYQAYHFKRPLDAFNTIDPRLSLTSQSSYSPPVVPTAPLVTPVLAISASRTATTAPTTGGSTPRRILTDDDRHSICEYHESHPGAKQSEIGALFSVERSTISKILRQKKKFLYSNNGSQGPVKKANGKLPDIEMALANWARNEQAKGEPLNDSKIRERAQHFAVTVGNCESPSKFTNSDWLEKFKQKNNLLDAKAGKGHSIEHDGIYIVDSSTTSLPMTPYSYPVLSDSGEMVSSTTSPNQNYDGFGTSDSPEPTLHPHLSSLESNFSHPRSQTSPLTVEPGALIGSEGQVESTPRNTHRTAVTPVLGSVIEESPTAVDPRQMMKRNKSARDIRSIRSMHPTPIPPLPRSENTSPVSSVGSPTQDDAKRALDLVWSFFQNQPAGILEPGEYATIGKLMVKLKLSNSPDGTLVLPGGIYPIDRSLSPRLSKKRTIDGIY